MALVGSTAAVLPAKSHHLVLARDSSFCFQIETAWAHSQGGGLPARDRRRSYTRVHGRKTIEGLLVDLPIRHEFDAWVMLDQIVERLAGFGLQML